MMKQKQPPRGWCAFNSATFLNECVQCAVFEISNCHVLCEEQASQPCRPIDLD